MNEFWIIVLLAITLYVVARLYLLRRSWRKAVKWKRRGKGGYIYFFRGRREVFWHVKIGRAKNPVQRLKAHRTGNPHGIVILGVFSCSDDVAAERHIHTIFARERLSKNNEWFIFSPRLLLYVGLVSDRRLTETIREAIKNPT